MTRAQGPGAFLSTGLAGRRAAGGALAAVLVSTLFFLIAAPFAETPLAPVAAFIPAYQSALVTCDLITAALLFGQFRFLRSRALYALACGYLFSALIAFVHLLSFPGAFSPEGLLGGRSQSTPWLFTFWHAGFPLFVLAYALFGDHGRGSAGVSAARSSRAIPAGIAAVLAAVCGLALLATAGERFLPALIVDRSFTPMQHALVSGALVLSVFTLAVLWLRRPYTVLDVWLMVVMCAWFFDIMLCALLNAARYDLGWYAGRIYGLLAASFLLVVLLVESAAHYARLARVSDELSAANESLEKLSLHDGLTGLANRRFFDAYLAEQVALGRRNKQPLALVLCDVDFFKAYNDQLGHPAGDECLKRIAAALRSCCRRPADKAARYGGEEFAMILPATAAPGAWQIAEEARRAVAGMAMAHGHSGAGPHVSISCGVAVAPAAGGTALLLIAGADRALFEAKRAGRNRTISAAAEARASIPPAELPLPAA